MIVVGLLILAAVCFFGYSMERLVSHVHLQLGTMLRRLDDISEQLDAINRRGAIEELRNDVLRGKGE